MHDAARVHVLERDDRLGEPEARAARRRADHLAAVAVRAQLRPELAPLAQVELGETKQIAASEDRRARARRGQGARARVPKPGEGEGGG